MLSTIDELKVECRAQGAESTLDIRKVSSEEAKVGWKTGDRRRWWGTNVLAQFGERDRLEAIGALDCG